ncbi:alpha/beta hydrolase [Pseudarthrobacter sulfonivorans]|jgi:alpha-beta hydrolase superfamily lysophospholipase|uniref:alpha/beta hydrolase n=1 Tax=Pseudarthrobacter sulfonivorans TaxID=121292 RepID=UPI002788878B|nr:alpha/beta hydrolase [Pseudarthrobacter sulfonivorans]MDP9996647.1 alpha-beta hydrolase superfamily lysophospholipase [Pseudarthrobacter sulfonivorans]
MTGQTPGTQPATEPRQDPGAAAWAEDFLGPSFQYQSLPLTPDDEGDVAATLIRHTARPPGDAGGINGRAHAVLYLHGWADYFLQAELAEQLSARGLYFYAVDLRKFGRSLRLGQTPGYATDLRMYDEDLGAALAAIRADLPQVTGPDSAPAVHVLAHSFGGLIAALWADRHPGELATLTLNSPWLELQGSSLIRNLAMHLVEPVARADPKRPFHLPEMPGYWQSVSSEAHGEWQLHPVWRPAASFPIRAGWAKAVLAGHAAVARGLDITAPVLVMLSDRTRIQAEWSEELMHADAVIDVEETASRALRLGRRVTVFRYPGAIHDVFLSERGIRQEAYQDVACWLKSYPCGAAASTAPP